MWGFVGSLLPFSATFYFQLWPFSDIKYTQISWIQNVCIIRQEIFIEGLFCSTGVAFNGTSPSVHPLSKRNCLSTCLFIRTLLLKANFPMTGPLLEACRGAYQGFWAVLSILCKTDISTSWEQNVVWLTGTTLISVYLIFVKYVTL